MSFKNPKIVLFLVMIVAMLVVAGCPAPAATPAPAGDTTAATAAPAASGAPQVGIVLPTKDEPRWLQDEARFKELLATAGVPVEISSARATPPPRRPTSSPC